MIIIGIMATTSEGVIGKENVLPWHYPSELNHMRTMTKGHPVVLGRKTFETIPSPFFKDRHPIIFSKQSCFKSSMPYTIVHNLKEFLALPDCFSLEKIFMIGGAQIAHLFLSANLISEFFLTKIHVPYQGDTYLNQKFFERWQKNLILSTPLYTIFKLTPLKISNLQTF